MRQLVREANGEKSIGLEARTEAEQALDFGTGDHAAAVRLGSQGLERGALNELPGS